MKFIIVKTHAHILIIVTILLLFFANIGPTMANPNTVVSSHELRITTTMNFLGDFATALLGEHGNIQSIVSGSTDPHFFEPSARDLINLQEADVILAIGHEEIDGWLTDFILDNPDLKSKVFNVIDLEEVLEYDPIIKSVNPHFWLSPKNALTMVENIKNYFIELQLIEKQIIEGAYLLYKVKIQTLITEIEKQALIFNGTKIIVDHPAFFYFLNLFGFVRMGAIEEREGIDPSPLHIQELRNLIKTENINLIIASKTQAGSDVNQLAVDTGSRIVFLTPLPGIEGAESYTDLIGYNLNSLENPVEPTQQDELNVQSYFIPLSFATLIILRKLSTKYVNR